mgnify:CR=1 FL=1
MEMKEKVDLVLTNLYRIETKGEATMIMADCIKVLASVSQEFAKQDEKTAEDDR